MDQLYDADYRNLSIPMHEAAWFVERFAKGMNKPEAQTTIEVLRGLRDLSVH
jgi:hypothetical protein